MSLDFSDYEDVEEIDAEDLQEFVRKAWNFLKRRLPEDSRLMICVGSEVHHLASYHNYNGPTDHIKPSDVLRTLAKQFDDQDVERN